MTPLSEQDRPSLEAFLRARLRLSMFALSNLARFGIEGGGHPHATTFWAEREGPGISAAVGLTEGGMVMPHLPQGRMAAAPAFLAGRKLTGLAGAPDEVEEMARRLGLGRAAVQHDATEPLFTLALSALILPDTSGAALVPVAGPLRALAEAWRRAYVIEVLGEDPGTAPARARREVDDMIANDTHRILMREGRPLAMTGFNAWLPDAVQIGGVYTPPELRGQGHAGAALALHLAEARAAGVRQAVLFAASEAAARAYRRLGFDLSGSYRLLFLRSGIVAQPG